MGVDLSKKAMYGTRDAANNWERDGQEHLESWRYQAGTQLEQFVSSRRAASFTNDAWWRLRGHGANKLAHPSQEQNYRGQQKASRY